jgi:hypothetical protein
LVSASIATAAPFWPSGRNLLPAVLRVSADQVDQVNLLVAIGIHPISYQAGRGLRDSLFGIDLGGTAEDDHR